MSKAKKKISSATKQSKRGSIRGTAAENTRGQPRELVMKQKNSKIKANFGIMRDISGRHAPAAFLERDTQASRLFECCAQPFFLKFLPAHTSMSKTSSPALGSTCCAFSILSASADRATCLRWSITVLVAVVPNGVCLWTDVTLYRRYSARFLCQERQLVIKTSFF